jgi:hypothetical protein
MEAEPAVVIRTVQYVEISYKDQKLCLPAKEAVDLIKPLAQLLPDDAGLK